MLEDNRKLNKLYKKATALKGTASCNKGNANFKQKRLALVDNNRNKDSASTPKPRCCTTAAPAHCKTPKEDKGIKDRFYNKDNALTKIWTATCLDYATCFL